MNNSKISTGRICAILYLCSALVETYFSFGGPYPLVNLGFPDAPYFSLIALHYYFGIVLLLPGDLFRRRKMRRLLDYPEFLLIYTLLLFLFSYIFALAANMDYVQHFIESGGNLRLALDTRTERGISLLRFSPFIVCNAGVYIFFRVRRRRLFRLRFGRRAWIQSWALLWICAAVFLSTAAQPSFLLLEGIPVLAWFALLPLFLVFSASSWGRGVYYGIVYGVFTALIHNYWLGTFSLISLQVTVLIFLILYGLFMPVLLGLYKKTSVASFLVLPLGFVVFDYLRSSGFLGYPWGMIGQSQYSVLPLIQTASLTGIWGVSFIVLLFNAGVSETIFRLSGDHGRVKRRLYTFMPVSLSAYAAAAAFFLGALVLFGASRNPAPADRTVKVSLVQQNSDPRKHSYRETLDALKRQTGRVLPDGPDLIAWSETAFVPNISRWSREDPEQYNLARLVREFLAYQKSLGTWLLTGNDDYEWTVEKDGEEVRFDYNAAVLFSDTGERVETYRKIRLVPFTEYFPYREQFPWFYQLLLDFDVNFWEPGTRRVVFRHPQFTFSTPICFEDVFPGEVRAFVREGAEVILNISNDYWSLTEVEAMQHFSGSLFRAVENRRPLLRATASGMTAHVDEYGRVKKRLPFFEEAAMTTELTIRERPLTVYSRFGDYFPLLCAVLLLLLFLFSLIRDRRAAGKRKTAEDGPGRDRNIRR